MKIIILFISVILTAVLYTQFNFINKNNNNLETFESVNPNKTLFETKVNTRLPCIFNNITDQFNDLQKFSLESINSLDKSTKKELINTLKLYFEYYLVPMTYKSNFNVLLEKEGTTTQLQRQLHYRLLISQLKGSKTVLLFPPNKKHKLYPDKTFNKSTINIWDTDIDEIPDIKNTTYLEVILFAGNMLYIPNNWWYSTLNNEDSYCIYQTSESVFSNFLKLK